MTDVVMVKGTLRSTCQEAEMRFQLSTQCGKPVWQQRALTDTAKHMNRDYVCNETIEEIEDLWFKHDWKRYNICIPDENDDTKAALNDPTSCGEYNLTDAFI